MSQRILDIPVQNNSNQKMKILDLPPFYNNNNLNQSNNLRRTNYQQQYKRQDEIKLIERSMNVSYLAFADPNKNKKQKNNVINIDLRQTNLMKSKIMQRTKIFKSMRQQSRIYGISQLNQQFQCQLQVQNLISQKSSCNWLCFNMLQRKLVYSCILTDQSQNTLLLKLSKSKAEDKLNNKQKNKSNIKTEDKPDNNLDDKPSYKLNDKLYDKPSFIINLNTIFAKVQKNPSQSTQQSVVLRIGKNFALQFKDPNKSKEKKLSSWFKFLSYRIENSVGKKHQIRDLQNRQFYYKEYYKLQRQFVQKCQTGDIMLFQSNNVVAKAQRLVTGSDFDHVGLIIRDPVYDILLYESNGSTGVCLTPWKLIIQKQWYKNVGKIVWRKLEDIKRDYDFIQQFHGFVTTNMNRKYYISFDKLMLKNSYVPQTKQEQGYFCSQLVARVYKALSLIPTQQKQDGYKPACNYIPFHFTQKGQLKLKRGYLSPQYCLLFNENVIKEDYSF